MIKLVLVKRIVERATLAAALLLLLLMAAGNVHAQQKKRVIQLSGVVLGEDSVSGLPGVHVYVPKAGMGRTTNGVGFFSMPVLVGDSIVISYIGYQRQHYIVPENAPEYLTIIVPLQPDTTYLQEIIVYDFPTEEVFKEAVLALNVPLDKGIDEQNMTKELLALMVKTRNGRRTIRRDELRGKKRGARSEKQGARSQESEVRSQNPSNMLDFLLY